MDVSDELLRHLYRYDRSLPLLSTSEPEAPLDPRTHAPIEGLRGERVTFASTHDERVLASLYRPAEGGPFPADRAAARLHAARAARLVAVRTR